MPRATVTENNYYAFKKSFETAQRGKLLTFDFEGQQVLTAYARYVCLRVEGLKLQKQKANLN